MKKTLKSAFCSFLFILISCILFTSCSKEKEVIKPTETTTEPVIEPVEYENDFFQIPLYKDVEETENFISTSNGNYTLSQNQIKINSSGNYQLEGKFKGQILIDDASLDVKIILNNATLVSDELSPVQILNANSVTFESLNETTNYIIDYRKNTREENLYVFNSNSNIEFKGKGITRLFSLNNFGLNVTKNVFLNNTNLFVYSIFDTLQSSNLLIDKGLYSFISTSSNCLLIDNELKVLNSAVIEIYSCYTGMTANDILIEGTDENKPQLSINTGSFSDFSINEKYAGKLLRVREDLYDTSCDYFIYAYKENYNDGIFIENNFSGFLTLYNVNYIYFGFDIPDEYTHFQIFITSSKVENKTLSSISNKVVFSSSFNTVNDKNTYAITDYNTDDKLILGYFTDSSLDTSLGENGKGIFSKEKITMKNCLCFINSESDCIYCSSYENNLSLEDNTISLTTSSIGIYSNKRITSTTDQIVIKSCHIGIQAPYILFNTTDCFIYNELYSLYASTNKKNTSASILVNDGKYEFASYLTESCNIYSEGSFTLKKGVMTLQTLSYTASSSYGITTKNNTTIENGTLILFNDIKSSFVLSDNVNSVYNITNEEYILEKETEYHIPNTAIKFTPLNTGFKFYIFSNEIEKNNNYEIKKAKTDENVFSWHQKSQQVMI